MKTVGELVREAMDLVDRGFYEQAFVPTAAAISETARKAFQKDESSDDDRKRFLKENWQLISFMGMGSALPLPMNISFGFKRIVPTFNVHHGAEEIILYVISQTLKINKLPDTIALNNKGIFEIKNNRLLLPKAVVSGLLGSVIFHPSNKDETIADKYWMSISDFKMFVSELWGRADLAQRIMKFYLERD
jgi:hypothetical protein